MENKIVFEISVYYCTKENHFLRWNKYYNNLKNYLEEHPNLGDIVIHEKIRNNSLMQWKYNRIIGEIIISINYSSVVFEIYKSTYQRYCYNSNKRWNLVSFPINNSIVYIAGCKTNVEIRNKIDVKLKEIIKENFKKQQFVDLECYNNLIDKIDFISLKNM